MKWSLRPQTAYLAAAALGLIASVVYLTQYGESGQLGITLDREAETLRHADSFLSKPTGIKYNADGSIGYQWRAERAERLPDGKVRLQSPLYTGLMENKREWTAQARHGTLTADGHRVTLREDVIVLELLHAARIETQTLIIDLNRNEISTTQAVSLSMPHGNTRSRGLRANLDKQVVELLSEVNSYYDGF